MAAIAQTMTSSRLSTSVIDVTRPVVLWNWRNALLPPIELLMLAFSVPFLILLVIVPFGLVLAGLVRIGRLVFGM